MGRYPVPGSFPGPFGGWGDTPVPAEGTPDSGGGGGTPVQDGGVPLPPDQNRASTCYAAGGKPLEVI